MNLLEKFVFHAMNYEKSKNEVNMTELNITQIILRPREMFSAVFEKYDSETKLAKNSIQLFDIRSRKGGVIKDNLVFAEKEVAKMPKNLSHGDYVAFLADLEFRNVEFMTIFEV